MITRRSIKNTDYYKDTRKLVLKREFEKRRNERFNANRLLFEQEREIDRIIKLEHELFTINDEMMPCIICDCGVLYSIDQGIVLCSVCDFKVVYSKDYYII
jgi:hypothetical protein